MTLPNVSPSYVLRTVLPGFLPNELVLSMKKVVNIFSSISGMSCVGQMKFLQEFAGSLDGQAATSSPIL